LNASELAVPIPLVRGRTAKIRFPRYKALNPNIARADTRGQSATSASNVADHAFISSETGGSFGRADGLTDERKRFFII
jgi:hypothetical protein